MSEWLKTFQTAPDGYVCREFDREDGVMEGVEIEHPIIGGTMTKDGEPVAYGGINLIGGRHWVFMFIKDPEIRKHGLWIARLIRDSIRMCRDGGITELYGLCDTTKPKAAEFLTMLGFKPLSALEKPADILLYEQLMGGAKTWRVKLRG